MPLIVPHLAVGSGDEITIDGVVYKVPLIDSDGHLQVDVLTAALPTGAATSARQDTMITALQLIDDLRNALAAVATDRLLVNTFATGASEVKAAFKITVSDSTARVTAITPSSGKKVRIISVHFSTTTSTAHHVEVYFGTGADITTNPGKEIAMAVQEVINIPSFGLVWPDGAGPVGAVNDVVSLRTTVNISGSDRLIVHYREE